MTTAYITHPDCEKHDMGGGHPESPHRLVAIKDHLMELNLWDWLKQEEAPKVTLDQLQRVHPYAYIEQMQHLCMKLGEKGVVLGPDVVANQYTMEAAFRAAGAAVRAVDLVMKGEVDNAFCAVRPPGHHAETARAMGFCIFGNVAVGVKHALEAYGLERVAVVDFDVHHGNGTEDLLQTDSRVMFFSSFQHPFYPHTVPDNSRQNIVHSPLYQGSGSDEFREIVADHWMPALHQFKPQMVFVSAGFDAHRADPLADIHLDERDYRWVTQEIKLIADEFAAGKIVSCLEGGYDLTALSRSVAQHLRVLMGQV